MTEELFITTTNLTREQLISTGICDHNFRFNRSSAKKLKSICTRNVPEHFKDHRGFIAAWIAFYGQVPLCRCGLDRQWSQQWKSFKVTCGNRSCYKKHVLSQQKIAERTIKTRKTCLERYGVPNGGCSTRALEKIQESMLLRHGVRSALSDGPIRTKFRAKNKEVFGFENPTAFGTPLFKKAMIERYGVENFNQTAQARYAISARASLQSNEALRFARLAQIAQLEQMHLVNDFSGTVTSNQKWRHAACGSVSISNLDDGKIPYCRTCFGKRSSLERLVSRKLDQAGIFYRRDDRTLIKPYELDFVFRNNLALEVSGKYWHQVGKRCLEISEKIELAKSAGVTLLHLWDHEVLNDFESSMNLVLFAVCGQKLLPGVYNIPGGLAPAFYDQGQVLKAPKIQRILTKNNLLIEDLGIATLKVLND